MAFADYIRDYFDLFPDADDDPQGLNEFRPTTPIEDIRANNIITDERYGLILIRDGSHRLITSALLGATSIRAFSGVPNGRESLSMKGDSTFLTLRIQFEAAQDDDERDSILHTCFLLANSSSNGSSAISNYWIDHAPNMEVADAGERILARLALS